jgi:para-nitrobenzyl esterase
MKLIAVADPEKVAADLPGAIAELCRIDVETAETVLDEYRRGRAARGEATDPSSLYIAIDGDANYGIPAQRIAQAQSAGGGDAFAAVFAWRSPDETLGAIHGLDVPFIFGTHRIPGMETYAGHGPVADALSDRLQRAWSAFIRATPGDELPGGWTSYDEMHRRMMRFDAEDRLVAAPYPEERRVWDGII